MDNIYRINDCETGCHYLSGGDIRHVKTCPNYPESLSELLDKSNEARCYKFHNPTEYPTRVEGEDFSVDVFILDETGVHGIAFWNFDDEVWRFHTDTLVDYNEKGAETKWKWYYPPFEVETVFLLKNNLI